MRGAPCTIRQAKPQPSSDQGHTSTPQYRHSHSWQSHDSNETLHNTAKLPYVKTPPLPSGIYILPLQYINTGDGGGKGTRS